MIRGDRIMKKEKMNKEKLFDALSLEDRMKLEVAEELGLLEKIKAGGWKALTAKETGQIGGKVANKKRAYNKLKNEEK